MIGKLSRPRVPSVSRARYLIDSFSGIDAEVSESLLTPKYCSYGYNIRLRSGALMRSYGVNDAEFTIGENIVRLPLLSTIGQRARKLHHYRRLDRSTGQIRDELIVFGTHRDYLSTSLTSSTSYRFLLEVENDSDDTEFINYYTDDKDCCLIFAGSGGMYVYDGESVTSYPEVKGFTSACMHYDRVFASAATEPDTIYFSAPLLPYEFRPEYGGGSISLMDDGGKIVKVVSFRNNIYIFREYSIYKLTAYTDPTDYTVSRIFSTKKKIRGETVAYDHSRLLFLAGCECYLFDGYSAFTRFFRKVTPLIEDASEAYGCLYDNRYFLSAVMKSEGDEKIGDEGSLGVETNNAVFVFDLLSNDVDIVRGADIIGFTAVVNGYISALLVTFANARGVRIGMIDDSGKLFGRNLPRHWRSAKAHFGKLADSKILRRLYVKTLDDVTIGIIADGDERVDRVYRGSRKVSGASFDLEGDDFAFVIDSVGENMQVLGFEATFDVNRRYVYDGNR